jgi:hypothetical protein
MVSVGYITQSPDTSADAEMVRFQLWREMSAAQKLALVQRVYHRGCKFILLGIQQQFSGVSPAQLKQLYWRKRWGDLLAYRSDFGEELMLEDPICLIKQLAVVFEALDIPYYVSGSVASSLQGEVRFTEDLDLVIAICSEQVSLLINALQEDFYISSVAVEEAIQGLTSSFNVIHLQTTEKADIFLSREDDFSLAKMSRRQWYNVEGEGFYVCSPEDSILQKLLWMDISMGQSQKQWRDILGVLKLQGESLDFTYLRFWGEQLGIIEQLQKGITEAGL